MLEALSGSSTDPPFLCSLAGLFSLGQLASSEPLVSNSAFLNSWFLHGTQLTMVNYFYNVPFGLVRCLSRLNHLPCKLNLSWIPRTHSGRRLMKVALWRPPRPATGAAMATQSHRVKENFKNVPLGTLTCWHAYGSYQHSGQTLQKWRCWALE